MSETVRSPDVGGEEPQDWDSHDGDPQNRQSPGEAAETETPASESDPRETPAREADEASGEEDSLVHEGDIAGDYLEKFLDVLDFDGDIDLDVAGGRALVSVDGGQDLEQLVGRDGEVLQALQDLTRLAVQQETGARSRLMLDIAGWRADRRSSLQEQGRSRAEQAIREGQPQRLAAMSSFERKVVHDVVADINGVRSEGDGEEPKRHVVIIPDGEPAGSAS